MSKPTEYRVRAVTRYLVTQHEDGRTQEVGEFAASEVAGAVAAALAIARRENGQEAVFIPYEGPPPGKVMRCKVVLTSKQPNVSLAYVGREEDAPGRYTLKPWEYERYGKKESGVSIELDPSDPANYRQDGISVGFSAVWGGTAEDGKNACRENRIFADATPSFTIAGTIRNADVTSQLNVGEEFYVDFVPAPKPAAE